MKAGFRLLLIILTIVVTTVVLQTAVRIEVLNAQAGFYLPRGDRNEDGSFSDGKWRVSLDGTPRDRLRELVQTFGLAQYLLAPFLLVLAAVQFWKLRGAWTRVLTMCAMTVALVSILLMMYRQYYQSLGW